MDAGRLNFAGSNGGPGLTTRFDYAFPVSYLGGVEQSLYQFDPSAYQGTDGDGTCVTGQDVQNTRGANLRGINWYGELPLPVIGSPSVPVDTSPTWGQLHCSGAFADHSGPFTLDFAGTVTFSGGPCFCATGVLQGHWVVIFGS